MFTGFQRCIQIKFIKKSEIIKRISNFNLNKSLDKCCYNLAMIFVSKSISNLVYGIFIVSCYYISPLLANCLMLLGFTLEFLRSFHLYCLIFGSRLKRHLNLSGSCQNIFITHGICSSNISACFSYVRQYFICYPILEFFSFFFIGFKY